LRARARWPQWSFGLATVVGRPRTDASNANISSRQIRSACLILAAVRRRIRASLQWAFISEEGTRTVTAVASVVAVVGVLATVVGVYIAVQQLSDLPDQRDMRGASIVMAVDQQLSAEHLRPVRRAIMKGQSLNDYDPDDLEDYLDILEGLAINYERHLVDFDTVDNWHGDTILKTYR